MSKEGRFQVGVGVVMEHFESKKILMLHRAPTEYAGNIWELPFGRIEQFESLEIGLKREVAEETGISVVKIGRPIRTFEFMRGQRSADNEVIGIVFEAFTSQEQVTLSHEHDDFKWVSIEEALELAETPGIKGDLIAFQKLN
jgi:8-oxo-dGTP diphosphatase